MHSKKKIEQRVRASATKFKVAPLPLKKNKKREINYINYTFSSATKSQNEVVDVVVV